MSDRRPHRRSFLQRVLGGGVGATTFVALVAQAQAQPQARERVDVPTKKAACGPQYDSDAADIAATSRWRPPPPRTDADASDRASCENRLKPSIRARGHTGFTDADPGDVALYGRGPRSRPAEGAT